MERNREEEHITVLIGPGDFESVKRFARGIGFEPKFAGPGPSRVRGVPKDSGRVYAKFVRKGAAGAGGRA